MTEHDMDLYAPLDDCGARSGEERTCGTCAYLIEGPCDFVACALEVYRKFKNSADACDAAEWALAHMHDAQADTCDEWEGFP